MRSITSISAALILAASGALAQSGPPAGCWERIYSDDHLARQPEQVVRWVQLHVYDQGGARYANLRATFVPQGHAYRAGILDDTMLDQSMLCWQDGLRKGCAVDCDGGAFHVVKELPGQITIETAYLMVGDTEGCGGALDLSEGPGRATRYLLRAAPMQSCLEP